MVDSIESYLGDGWERMTDVSQVHPDMLLSAGSHNFEQTQNPLVTAIDSSLRVLSDLEASSSAKENAIHSLHAGLTLLSQQDGRYQIGVRAFYSSGLLRKGTFSHKHTADKGTHFVYPIAGVSIVHEPHNKTQPGYMMFSTPRGKEKVLFPDVVAKSISVIQTSQVPRR